MPRFVDAFRSTLGKGGPTAAHQQQEEAAIKAKAPMAKSNEDLMREKQLEWERERERERESEREHERERVRERDRERERGMRDGREGSKTSDEEEEFDSEEEEEEPGQSKLRIFQRSDFQVGGMIGQGSFATVHKAKQLATGRDVALKVVRPESELDFGTGPNGSTPAVSYKDVLKAMRQEVLLMEMIGVHPNVVEVLGTAEDCRVFVMERAASDLYTIVKQQERNLPLQLAKLWTGHMLAAVQYMHEHGVVHQDIKSSNVLIFSDRSAKICDFGLARRGKPTMSVDRELVTLWYRPPELLMGESSYSPKVDEWGVGCILLEMMIGSSPFKGKPDCVCQCPQITHRNYNSDQLMKIFAVVGTPRERALLSRMACSNHFSKWPVFPRKLDSTIRRMCTSERLWRGKGSMPTDKEVEDRANAWVEIIGGLLHLDFRERLTSNQALESDLFVSRRSAGAPAGSTAPAVAGAAASGPVRRSSIGTSSAARQDSASSTPVHKSSPGHADGDASRAGLLASGLHGSHEASARS